MYHLNIVIFCISLSASGVGLFQLRHREEFMARRSGRQEEGQREAPRQAQRGVHLRVNGRLPRVLGSLGRAAVSAVKIAAAVVHVERVRAILSLRRRRFAQRRG